MDHPAYQSTQSTPPTSDEALASMPPQKPSGRNWKKWFVMFLIADLLILAGIYFLVLSKKTSKPQQQTISQTAPSPSPALSPDLISDWIPYTITPLGLEFKLPPHLNKPGAIKTGQVREGAEGGKALDLIISDPPTLAFGARSRDFQEGREYTFLDAWGYNLKDDNYYGIKYISTDEFSEQIPTRLVKELTNKHGIKILKITGENSTLRDAPLPFNPGKGKIGALVNIPNNTEYRGFAVEMTIGNGLTENEFDQILSTFKLSSKSKAESLKKPCAETCDITEWGIRLSFADANKLEYQISTADNREQSIRFYLKDSVTIIENCKPTEGAFARVLNYDPDKMQRLIIKLGNYNYILSGPKSPYSCDGENEINNLRVRIGKETENSANFSLIQ
jgi:hypothetical protein